MRRTISAILIVCMLALFITACGNKETETTDEDQEKENEPTA